MDLRLDVARDVEVVAVGGYFVEGDDAGDTFHIGVVTEPGVDAFDVLGEQFVLGAARFEFFRRIDDQHFVSPLLRFLLPEDKDAGGEARAVKSVDPRPISASSKSMASSFCRIPPSLPIRNNAPCGSTTAMRPVLGTMDLIMCCTKA